MANTDFDIEQFRTAATQRDRYEQQIERVQKTGKDTKGIKAAVSKAVSNVSSGISNSFVIYGEPQSGKTEMMICLTAKLLDAGYGIIVHLLNDSVQLLQQNLDRFQRSGLAPAAKNFSDVLDPDISLKSGQHVIFCKKNSQDLNKLIQKTSGLDGKIIIDDEADFATPNAKINKGEVTTINRLIRTLIAEDGAYIGVTATPARLDLNNTFDNDSDQWVDFPPHPAYTGQDVFFPIDTPLIYNLELLPDTGDDPKYLREALFRFMIRVARINLAATTEQNYSILIHTSGKKLDHRSDKKPIDDVLAALGDVNSKKFETYVREIRKITADLYGDVGIEKILYYIIKNCSRTNIIIMNSERDKM